MFKKMPFDFKKEFKEFYMPKNEPATVAIMDNCIEENGYRNDFIDVREPLINRFFFCILLQIFFCGNIISVRFVT